MKKLVAVSAVIAGLALPVTTANAATGPDSAPAATQVGSSTGDIFSAVCEFLNGGWAGRPKPCIY
ncbi:hypothetical protein [Nocardia ignorata]|uniref:Uncharacterized protein n=1 Tax=Nocardia ignorata TaxID=145285 RepID=A0A4R6PPV5_NOCIG|nr:hypothetical protein [Nocardia ignorata]TDP39963.1 hypothetical protein DFR75_102684 [Nocardia ignorata]